MVKYKKDMKYFIICLVSFFTVFAKAQSFDYKKIHLQGQSIKLKGRVLVTDTLVTIIANKTPSVFHVTKTVDAPGVKQFKVIGTGDYNIRMTLNNPEPATNTNPKTFVLEMRDAFSGSYTTTIYYLIPINNEDN